jgi:hypothetical protein
MQRLAGFVVLAALLSGVPGMAAEPMTYETFVAHAQALHAGQTRAEIVAALGKPTEETATYLGYSLAGLKPMPPPVGATYYYAAQFDMKDGRMVGTVKWAWMDTTGMAVPPPHH